MLIAAGSEGFIVSGATNVFKVWTQQNLKQIGNESSCLEILRFDTLFFCFTLQNCASPSHDKEQSRFFPSPVNFTYFLKPKEEGY